MRKLRELSKLPEDPAYWEQLEARIVTRTQVAGTVEAAWWVPLAARATALGGLAIAAGIAALLLIPPRGSPKWPAPGLSSPKPAAPGARHLCRFANQTCQRARVAISLQRIESVHQRLIEVRAVLRPIDEGLPVRTIPIREAIPLSKLRQPAEPSAKSSFPPAGPWLFLWDGIFA